MQNSQQVEVYACTTYKYLPFFWQAFLREPLTIYSVTVATDPPGPSRTTP